MSTYARTQDRTATAPVAQRCACHSCLSLIGASGLLIDQRSCSFDKATLKDTEPKKGAVPDRRTRRRVPFASLRVAVRPQLTDLVTTRHNAWARLPYTHVVPPPPSFTLAPPNAPSLAG